MSKIKNPKIKSHFTKVPNLIIETSRLKPAEKLLVIYVLSFEKCFAGLNTIAKRLGYSRSTVQRAMTQLQLKGVIDKVRAGGHSSFYVVKTVENWDTFEPKNEL